MTNRLKQYQEQPPEPDYEIEYWQVTTTRYLIFYVEPETAAVVMALIDRRWPPRWLNFTDIFGSAIRIRSSEVVTVSESTHLSRRRSRVFDALMQGERHDEQEGNRPPWEDCD